MHGGTRLAGSRSAGASAASPEDELLATFAPVLAVRDQPADCDSGEPYLPMSVEDLFATPGLILRGPDGETVDQPSLDDLAGVAPGDDWHIDVPGNALSPECTYEQLYDGIGAEPVVYGRVVTDPAHPGNVVVQYWFFYIYNDWNDRHEGDWEMIQLVFDADDASAALLTEPTQVMYAQHEGGELSAWDGGPLQRRDGTHPVVFAAEGSHAAYFSAERWFGKSAQSGFGCDDTRPPTVEVSPRVVPLRGDESWLAFTGRWGEQQPSFNNGPDRPVDEVAMVGPRHLGGRRGPGRRGRTPRRRIVRHVGVLRDRSGRLGRVPPLPRCAAPGASWSWERSCSRSCSSADGRDGAARPLSPVFQRRRAGQHLGAAILLIRTTPCALRTARGAAADRRARRRWSAMAARPTTPNSATLSPSPGPDPRGARRSPS